MQNTEQDSWKTCVIESVLFESVLLENVLFEMCYWKCVIERGFVECSFRNFHFLNSPLELNFLFMPFGLLCFCYSQTLILFKSLEIQSKNTKTIKQQKTQK